MRESLNLSRQVQAISGWGCTVAVTLLMWFGPACVQAQSFLSDIGVSYKMMGEATGYGFIVLQQRPPPFGTGRVVLQVAVGTGVGVGAGYLGGVLGAAASGCSDGDFLCGLGGALLGVGIGLTAGSALGGRW